MNELVLQITNKWGINYVAVDGERITVPLGGVIAFGESNAVPLLQAAKQGAGSIRLSTPTDRVIPAPKSRRVAPWTIEEVKETYGQRTAAGGPSVLHSRALELMTEAPLLMNGVVHAAPAGVQSFFDLTAWQLTNELNAKEDAERQKGRAALTEARAYPAKLKEIELENVRAEAEAKTLAATEGLKAAKAVAGSSTTEELRDALEQETLQVQVFERAGELLKLEPALKRQEKARKALDERAYEEASRAARALLQPILETFDAVPAKVADRARPLLEATQAAIAAGRFNDVHTLAEQLRLELVPRIEWATETRPAMFGSHVGIGN